MADIFSKKWSLTDHFQFWLLAILSYVIANIFWLKARRPGSGLARGGVIFSVTSAMAAIIIGIILYKKSINKIELVGMALGVISLVLILWN